MTLEEAIKQSEYALATAKSEWQGGYPYKREPADHHLTWQHAINEMKSFLSQGKTLEEWLAK